MLFNESCSKGQLQVDATTVRITSFKKVIWSVPRQAVTRISLKKGMMKADLTIHTVQGAYPANWLTPQHAEKFLALFPGVEVGAPEQVVSLPPTYPPQQSFDQPYWQSSQAYPQQSPTPPQPQSDTFSQPQFYSQPTWQGQPMPPFQQRRPSSRQRFFTWFRGKSRKAQFSIGCGSIIGLLLLCSFCGVISNVAGLSANTTPTPTTASTQVVDQPTQDNSQLLDTPTDVATTAPTPSPTPTMKPTATSIPTHASQPTPQPTQPSPKPTPCPGINCNPWGYNFSPGNEIFNPPSSFCSYFNCIPSFWGPDDPGDGYINECVDGTYSQSGGERGDCSSHGGELRPLYSH